MTGEAWRQYVQAYVELRRATGFSMQREESLLQDFVAHLERRGHDAPVAQVAVEWASASTESQHAGRLSIVRGFLTMVRAAEPDVDVPGAGLVRTCKRPTPRILAPDEIVALMDAARSLGPPDALRPHTVATVIGCWRAVASAAARRFASTSITSISSGLRHAWRFRTPSSGSRASCRSIPRPPPRCGPTPSNVGFSATTA